MRLAPVLILGLAVSACQSTGLGGPSAAQLTPTETATLSTERLAECAANEIRMTVTASALKTAAVEANVAGKRNTARKVWRASERLVKRGALMDQPWMEEVKKRPESPEFDAAWKKAMDGMQEDHTARLDADEEGQGLIDGAEADLAISDACAAEAMGTA